MLHTVEVRRYWSPPSSWVLEKRVTATLACWTTLPGPQMEDYISACSLAFNAFSHQGKQSRQCIPEPPAWSRAPCSRIPPLPPPTSPCILTTWLTCFPSIVGLLHRLVPMPKGFFHIPLAFGCQFKSLCLKDTSPKPQTCCAKCG